MSHVVKAFLRQSTPPPPHTHSFLPPCLFCRIQTRAFTLTRTHTDAHTYLHTSCTIRIHTHRQGQCRRAATQTERGGGPVWRWGWTEERRKLRKLDLSMTNHKAGKPRLLTKMIKLRITSSTSYAVPGMKRNPQTTQLSIAHKKYARHIHTRRLRTAVVTANGISGD